MALGQLPEADLEGSEEQIFAEINITPLTDIFLVMLIIFMVSASAALEKEKERREEVEDKVAVDERAGLKVNLPAGSTQELDPATKSLIIAIAKDGQIAVNDENVAPDALDGIFQSAFNMNKGTQVVIKADKGVDHGTVVAVMEKAKNIGLSKLAIQTRGN